MSTPTDIVLAIDGGASRTRSWIARLDGSVLARGTAGGSNVFDLGVDVTRRVIAEATHAAWRTAGLPGEKPCAFLAIFAGVAGAGAPEDQRALAAALAAEFGVNPANTSVVTTCVSRTPAPSRGNRGSCFWRAPVPPPMAAMPWATPQRRAAGGSMLDDGGSGHWLGVQAMRFVIRVADGRAAPTALAESVLSQLEITTPRAILNRLQPAHPAHLTRAAIARLAPLVMVAANAGDEAAARNPGSRGARTGGHVGGCVASTRYRQRFLVPGRGRRRAAGESRDLLRSRCRCRQPTAAGSHARTGAVASVAGALLLALGVAGRPTSRAIVQQLRDTVVEPAV